MLAAHNISKCPCLTISMKVTKFEVASSFCHYHLSMQAFAKLFDAEQSLVISCYGYILFLNHKTFQGPLSVNYSDVHLEWQET